MAMNPKTLRPRVSGFNPKSISGLYAWYDAADATTITQATGVSAWADKSGNGRTCSQATGANQPAYVLAGQNGKNVIDFASHTKNMFTNGTAWALTSTNTMFWSFQFPDTAASAASWQLFDFNVVRQLVYGTATSDFRIANTSTGITPVSRRWYILSIQWNGAATAYRLNQSASTTINPTGFTSGASTQMYMGYNGGIASIRGYIGECITYDSTLTNAQTTTVNNYLAKKWGATIV
jgi:hypothetical protein